MHTDTIASGILLHVYIIIICRSTVNVTAIIASVAAKFNTVSAVTWDEYSDIARSINQNTIIILLLFSNNDLLFGRS